jgi:hypothetical protein
MIPNLVAFATSCFAASCKFTSMQHWTKTENSSLHRTSMMNDFVNTIKVGGAVCPHDLCQLSVLTHASQCCGRISWALLRCHSSVFELHSPTWFSNAGAAGPQVHGNRASSCNRPSITSSVSCKYMVNLQLHAFFIDAGVSL